MLMATRTAGRRLLSDVVSLPRLRDGLPEPGFLPQMVGQNTTPKDTPMPDSFADDTKQPLGQPVTAYECFGVFKYYNGNAPAGSTAILCATKELAEQVAAILTALDPHYDGPLQTDDPDADFAQNFSWDFTDGSENSSSYTVNTAVGRSGEIAQSLAEARRLLLGEPK